MPFTFTNFLYDPSRDGYDTSSWRTLFGDPAIVGGNLSLTYSAVVHRGDCVRGDLVMNINVPSEPAVESRKFGFYSPNMGSYAWFSIQGPLLLAEISDGTSSDSEEVDWSDGVNETWNSNDIEYRIQWEAGLVSFYINGTKKAVLSGNAVPKSPMAIYLSNATEDSLTIKYINLEAVQSFFMHTDESDTETDPESSQSVGQGVNVDENIVSLVQLGDTSSTEAVSVGEDVTVASS
jgi:hypothetical protein